MLVKAAAINSLYSTKIWGVREVAEVIFGSGIDPKLEGGSDVQIYSMRRQRKN